MIKGNITFYPAIFTCLLLFSNHIAISQMGIDKNALDPEKALTQYISKQWTTDNGLPSNSILDETKTSDGYLWFATFGGLVRFDGVNFKVFNKENFKEFKTDGVLSLFEDSKKNLWIGSNGGGLLRYKDGRFKVFEDKSRLRSSIITSIQEDNDGNLWVGTRRGLSKISKGKFQAFENEELLSHLNIYVLNYQNDGRLWIGTIGNGLYQYYQGKITHFTTKNGLSSNSIRAIFRDKSDRLWLGTDNGLTIYENGKFGKCKTGNAYLKGIINEIVQDKAGTLWFGTDEGLVRHSGNDFDTISDEIEWGGNTIQTIFDDEIGNLWLGTYRFGIIKLKDGKFKNFTTVEGLPHNIINIIYPDEGKVWAGTHNGLALINGKHISNFQLGQPSTGNRVRDIIKTSSGNLWICTYDGLVNFNGHKITNKYTTSDGLSSNRVRTIEEDKDGNLWIGTQDGLNLYKDGGFTVFDRKNGLHNGFIMSILADNNNNIWIGTNGGGLYKYNGNNFECYTSKDGLPSDVIFQMYEDSMGMLWIGTNSGLVRFDGERFRSFSVDDGLISNTIFQVMEDELGYFWISTNKGLSRVPRKELNDLAEDKINKFRHSRGFTKADGMIDNEITGAAISGKSADGKLWFATLGGVSAIDPRKIPVNTTPPVVLIEKVIINDSTYEKQSLENIPPGRFRYEFHYTGLSYRAPEKVTFKYKLENFDKEWIDVGRRRVAYYTNVPPGKYTFRVKAANEDGVWNEEGASIAIVKKAYFYQTIWFTVLVVCTLVALAIIVYFARVKSFRYRNEALSRMVDARTRNIKEQKEAIEQQKDELKRLNAIKDKLFSIVSHDLRSPLASFSSLLHLISTDNLTKEEFKSLSHNLKGNITQLTYLMDNLLNWVKSQMQGITITPQHFDLFEVINETFEILQSEADRKNIQLENYVIFGTKVFADKNMTRLVVRNLVANAIKFTFGGGRVMVSATLRDDHVEIEVADTGVGISEENIPRVFDKNHHYSMLGTSNEVGTGLGLLICREFVDQSGGKIWVESKVGEGSNFKFTITQAIEDEEFVDM